MEIKQKIEITLTKEEVEEAITKYLDRHIEDIKIEVVIDTIKNNCGYLESILGGIVIKGIIK